MRDLSGAASLMTAAWRIALLDETEPEYPPEAVRYDLLRAGRPMDRTSLGWLARDRERTVALCTVVLKHGHGNEHAAWMTELWVLPSHRRRGIGSQLLAEAVAFARSGDRSLLSGNHYEGAAASIAFAAHHGATPASAIEQNRVLVANLDRGLLAGWNTTPAGYSLVAFDDVCPDDLLDGFVRVSEALNDAPRSDSAGDAIFSAELRRNEERAMRADGTTQWVACARDNATGELAGMTELTLTSYQPWLVHQGTTVVDRRHRGHGLGRWLKSVNALRVLGERTETRVIETWNDGTNAPMLAINREMGFRPVATWRDVELRIDR